MRMGDEGSVPKRISYLYPVMSPLQLEIRNGILLAFMGFLWLLMENALGLHREYLTYQPFVFWMIILLPMGVIYWSLKYRRDKKQGGSIKLLEALKYSSVITASCSLASPLFVWLYVSVVNPDYLLLRRSSELKRLTEDNLDISTQLLRTAEIQQHYSTLHYLISAFVFSLAVCSVLSVVISILIRKRPLAVAGNAAAAVPMPAPLPDREA